MLRDLIEQQFPFLDKDKVGRLYNNVIECINFKDHVRKF